MLGNLRITATQSETTLSGTWRITDHWNEWKGLPYVNNLFFVVDTILSLLLDLKLTKFTNKRQDLRPAQHKRHLGSPYIIALFLLPLLEASVE